MPPPSSPRLSASSPPTTIKDLRRRRDVANRVVTVRGIGYMWAKNGRNDY